jgi:hypothetical protein
MQKISSYIVVLVSFVGCFSANIWAQDAEESEEKMSLFQGIKIEVDVFSAAMSVINSETYSFEGNIQLNLRKKYFPIVEIGFAGANKTSINDFKFKTDGVFARIGMDYNLLQPNRPDTHIHRYFFIGGRYGFSPFSYDITNVVIDNEYWGGSEVRNFYDINTTKHWLEVVAGLRVEVLRNIYMGWNVRLKMQLGRQKPGEVSPWFIPGIGIQSIGNWGFNYTVGYKF